MALPTNVGYCRVSGRFIRAIIDGSDADSLPDAIPLANLTVTFTANLSPARVRNAAAVPPVTIFVDPITVTTDAQGYLVDARGVKGITLVASNDPDLTPSNWTYKASIRGGPGSNIGVAEFSFIAPENGDIDLAQVIPVAPSPGADIVGWQDAVLITGRNAQVAQAATGIAQDGATRAAASALAAALARDESRTIAANIGDVRLDAEVAADSAAVAAVNAQASRVASAQARDESRAAAARAELAAGIGNAGILLERVAVGAYRPIKS